MVEIPDIDEMQSIANAYNNKLYVNRRLHSICNSIRRASERGRRSVDVRGGLNEDIAEILEKKGYAIKHHDNIDYPVSRVMW